MTRRPDELFDKIKIKKLCSDIQITDEQRNAAKEWLSLLENNKLESEQQNRPKFEQIILQKILGFTVYDFVPEKNDIDYTFSNPESGNSLCIEVKGTSTKDLFAYQDRGKKDKENPVTQTWTYMGLGYDYGVCTNYNDFILLTMSGRTHKVHKFNFLSIKDTKNQLNEDNLKEFIGIFSKSRIFAEGIVERLTNESIIAEQEFTDEFYRLFHETRLMLIKEFSSLPDVTTDEAIRWAQIYLNRLIFVFFVEDHNFIPDRLFAKRILSILKSPSISEHTKIISENINDLFKIMNIGSKIHGVNGFNGGLFEKEIPPKIFFSDIKDPQFFKEQRQNSKLSQKSLLVDIDINLSNQYADSLNPIIKNLLIMDSYDFTSDLNVNILGHIFEQSISDLESLHEQETTKRKRDGVYYTPEYITDYICRNTIIPYLSNKGITSVSELVEEYASNIKELEDKIRHIKILDPACGSGAFLVKAVDILLEIDEKIQFYKPRSAIIQRGLEEYSKVKEINLIVESNIFGVDINPESVEITKLSLFLKLAGPNTKLSYLSNNIKIGNSLVDDKIVDDHAFCWSDEFPEILGSLIEGNGFDIVIGNPPYVRQEIFKEIKPHLKIKYNCYNSIADLYVYFVEKGVSLLKEKGFLSFILPNKFMKTGYGEQIRHFLKKNTKLRTIYDFDDYPVFSDVTTYPMIMILEKEKNPSNYEFSSSTIKNKNVHAPLSELIKNEYRISANVLTSTPWALSDSKTTKIMEKMNENTISLDEFVSEKIFYGMKTGRNDVFIINKDLKNELIKDPHAKDVIKKVVTGTEVKRYRIDFEDKYVLFLPWNYDLNHSQKIHEYLSVHKSNLEERAEVKSGRHNWWALTRYGSENSYLLSEPKIIYPCISQKSNFCLDETGEFHITNNNFFISSSSKSLLAILNSNLISYFLKQKCPSLSGGFHDFRREYVKQTPIHNSISKYNKILSENASKILEYNKKLLKEKKSFWNRIDSNFQLIKINQKMNSFTELTFIEFLKEIYKKTKIRLSLKEQDEWEEYFEEKKDSILSLKDKIIQLDKMIDSLVYQMYELDDDEIVFIEEYLKR